MKNKNFCIFRKTSKTLKFEISGWIFLVCVAVKQSWNSQVILAGYRLLLPFLTKYPSCICIIIMIIDVLEVVCDCLSTTFLWCVNLSASTPWWMTCFPGLLDQEGHRQHQGKGARKADYFVQCGRVGLVVLGSAIWLPLLVFLQVNPFQVRGVLTAVEIVV